LITNFYLQKELSISSISILQNFLFQTRKIGNVL